MERNNVLTEQQQHEAAWLSHKHGIPMRKAEFVAKLVKPENTMQYAFANAIKNADMRQPLIESVQ